jgi:hypothetical protein
MKTHADNSDDYDMEEQQDEKRKLPSHIDLHYAPVLFDSCVFG